MRRINAVRLDATRKAVAGMSEGITYLASPYSHPAAEIREWRFQAACQAAAHLMELGYIVYSPIAHTHPIAMAGKLPTDWEYWRRVDEAFLERCSKLIVLHIVGWDTSVGVQAEMKIAERLGLPIRHIGLEEVAG